MIRLKIIYTLTILITMELIQPMPIEEVRDKGTVYCYWHLRYHKK